MSFMSVRTCEFSNSLQKHNQINYWFVLLHQKAEILKSINGCCRWKRATCLSVSVSVSWHWFSKPYRRFFHHESSLYGIHQHLIVCMMSTGTKWLEIPSTWQIIWLSHKRRQWSCYICFTFSVSFFATCCYFYCYSWCLHAKVYT